MPEVNVSLLPDVALEKIFSFLSYDEIASNRLVCKQFNTICGRLLTKGFIQLEKRHAHIYKIVKALLPRRPSERRSNMIVTRYCEILQGMETRIRMLNVTYMRYIDQHLICFVPGKVLDEIKRLLGLLEQRFDPPQNNNQLLEELRDLSSMAMEHFDEHILPHLEKREETLQFKNIIPVASKPAVDDKTQEQLKRINKRNRIIKSKLTYLIAKTRRICSKYNRQNIRVKKQSSVIKEQNAKLKVQSTRLENHEMTIAELKKKIEELQSNFMEVKSKLELGLTQSSIHTSPNPVPTIKEADIQEIEQTTLSKNVRKIKQFESLHQKYGILRKLCNRNNSESRSIHKPQNVKESARRKCVGIDTDKWRHRCPSSRLSYSLWYRNFVKNRLNKTELLSDRSVVNNDKSTNTEETRTKSKENTEFVYKSIIKQRPSRVFPLTCLELERKRKSDVPSEIPTKIIKNIPNSMNALDLIHKYLPGPQQCEVESSITSAVIPFHQSSAISYKRKRI